MQMSMVRIGLRLMAILIIAFAISIGEREANAQSRVGTLKVAPGAKVTVRGSTVTVRAARGVSGGTYNCGCAVETGKDGTCTLKETRSSVTCTKEPGDTCGTICTLVKQSGIGGGAAARPGGAGKPSVASPR
jgi:hypothetical protein